MPSPFPGMNPYLEHPELFLGFYHWLIIEIARFISPLLRPQYRVLNDIYDVSGYDLVIDYNQQPVPLLAKHDGDWADTLLRQQGLR